MEEKGAFIERMGAFWPTDKGSAEIIRQCRGKEALIKVHTPRNMRQYRLFHALLDKVVEGGAWSGTKDGLKRALKLEVGEVEYVKRFDGTMGQMPNSTAPESMTQARFDRFFDRCCHEVCVQLLGGYDKHKLRQEVEEMIAGRLPERRAG